MVCAGERVMEFVGYPDMYIGETKRAKYSPLRGVAIVLSRYSLD